MHPNRQLTIESLFNDVEIKEFLETVGDIERAGVVGGPKWNRTCGSAEVAITDDNLPFIEKLMDAVIELNDTTFEFKLDGFVEFEYLDYRPIQWFRQHCDSGHDTVQKRKLTAILQLSDPSEYIGCKTRVWTSDKERYLTQDKGSVGVFPSILQHQANPLWWGRRKALVAWFNGKTGLK